MSESKPDTATAWVDPDDSPEWTDEMFETAEYSIGRKVIRPASGYLGPNGVVRGRPPLRGRPKRQVTLRLDPDVIDRFRATGAGWQSRINDALRKAAGLE
jgi:uncharacterized protein (DUF4415 family)